MREDKTGVPKTGASGATLGVRLSGRSRDIDVGADGMVSPNTGGLSVSPLPPQNLPEHRRPAEFGGISDHPVFVMDTDDLPPKLRYRPDPANPKRHGFIEPAQDMSSEEYQRAVHGTRSLWKRV
jgi:hypothetical protein